MAALRFLYEQRHAAGTVGHALDHLPRERVTGGKLAHHVMHLLTIERHQRNSAVMRACAPRRPELGAGGDENEQRRQRSALGNAPQKIKRARVGPMLDDEDDGLDRLPLFQPSASTGLTDKITKGAANYLDGKTDADMRCNAVVRVLQNIGSAFKGHEG